VRAFQVVNAVVVACNTEKWEDAALKARGESKKNYFLKRVLPHEAKSDS
jgi:hypothetical protein